MVAGRRAAGVGSEQRVVTGVSNGRYRLEIGASTQPLGFVEGDYSNNVSWVDIRMRGNSAKILSYGPAA